MRRTLLFVLALWGTGAGSELLACGNKFLVASRGTRFDRPPAAREAANILVYAHPGSVLSESLGDVPVTSLLLLAGYQPIEVADPQQLDAALARGGWDIVLAGLEDSAALRARLQGPDAPVILPVLYRPTRTQLAHAKAEYDEVIKAPIKSRRLVETVDFAVLARAE